MTTKKVANQKNKVARKSTTILQTNVQQKNLPQSPYTVEKGIPVEGVRSFSLVTVFPFESMNVGDSFLISPDDRFAKNPNTIHYAAQKYAKIKPGFTLTTRLQLNKFRRVWRIK